MFFFVYVGGVGWVFFRVGNNYVFRLLKCFEWKFRKIERHVFLCVFFGVFFVYIHGLSGDGRIVTQA